MNTLSKYRSEARAALKGNWCVSALYYFVFQLVTIFINLLLIYFAGSLILSICIAPFAFGLAVGMLRQLRGKDLQFGWLFGNFNWRIWGTLALKYFYSYLWAVLFIVPGIVSLYSYAMTYYILEDAPELKFEVVIDRSIEMMRGHRWELFVLDLTFIGWYSLGILTLGIAWYWIIPYHMTARAAFYEDLKKQMTPYFFRPRFDDMP